MDLSMKSKRKLDDNGSLHQNSSKKLRLDNEITKSQVVASNPQSCPSLSLNYIHLLRIEGLAAKGKNALVRRFNMKIMYTNKLISEKLPMLSNGESQTRSSRENMMILNRLLLYKDNLVRMRDFYIYAEKIKQIELEQRLLEEEKRLQEESDEDESDEEEVDVEKKQSESLKHLVDV